MTNEKQAFKEALITAAEYVKEYRPSSCTSYAKLMNDPIWRGTYFRARAIGLRDKDIEDALQVIPPVARMFTAGNTNPRAQQKVSYLSMQSQEAIAKCVLDFNPEELVQLPQDTRDTIIRSWTSYQRGKLEGPSNAFDTKYIKAMHSINAKIIGVKAV